MTPPRTPRYHWEDFPAGSVREFGAARVTREAVLAFARESDPQPFHLDDDVAEASLFGRLSTSGWHTCDQDAAVVLTMEGWGLFRRRSPGDST